MSEKEQNNVHIVEAASTVSVDKSEAVVVLESKSEPGQAFADLQVPSVRERAIGWATSKGIAKASLSSLHLTPYPVDDKGQEVTTPALPPGTRYRVDVKVVRGI